MYHYILKFLKFGFWFLFPILFISNTHMETVVAPNSLEGNYDVVVSGAIERSLQGKAFFETNMDVSSKDSPYSTLTLKFKNDGMGKGNIIEFIISKQNQSKELAAGQYEIGKNNDGLLNGFDGVFGYANIGMTGEKPFFATKGRVIVTGKSKTNLIGSVRVSLVGTNGNKIFVKGDFHAIRNN